MISSAELWNRARAAKERHERDEGERAALHVRMAQRIMDRAQQALYLKTLATVGKSVPLGKVESNHAQHSLHVVSYRPDQTRTPSASTLFLVR